LLLYSLGKFNYLVMGGFIDLPKKGWRNIDNTTKH